MGNSRVFWIFLGTSLASNCFHDRDSVSVWQLAVDPAPRVYHLRRASGAVPPFSRVSVWACDLVDWIFSAVHCQSPSARVFRAVLFLWNAIFCRPLHRLRRKK